MPKIYITKVAHIESKGRKLVVVSAIEMDGSVKVHFFNPKDYEGLRIEEVDIPALPDLRQYEVEYGSRGQILSVS